MRRSIIIHLSVVSENEAEAVKAWEVLGRAAIGMSLDGISVSLTVGVVEDDEEEGPPS